MSTWTERESRELTVALVVEDGHRMRLVGDERRTAVERMTAAGHDRATIAFRLCITVKRLENWAAENNVTLPRTQGAAWWVAVAHPHRGLERRRHYTAGRQAGRVPA